MLLCYRNLPFDTLKRAIGLMERHASMAELKNANSFTQALFVLAQACTLSSADANRLTVLIQDTKSAEACLKQSIAESREKKAVTQNPQRQMVRTVEVHQQAQYTNVKVEGLWIP